MYLKIDNFTLTLICKIPVKYYTTYNPAQELSSLWEKEKKKSGSAATRHSYKALEMMQQSLPTRGFCNKEFHTQ